MTKALSARLEGHCLSKPLSYVQETFNVLIPWNAVVCYVVLN